MQNAYSSLKEELNKEVAINKTNEKAIRFLNKELEECKRTIALQNNTIEANEVEIEELKSQISNLENRLRIALKKSTVSSENKEAYITYLEQQLIELQEEVNRLKTRIQELFLDKYNTKPKDNTSMASVIDYIERIYNDLNRVESYIDPVYSGAPITSIA